MLRLRMLSKSAIKFSVYDPTFRQRVTSSQEFFIKEQGDIEGKLLHER